MTDLAENQQFNFTSQGSAFRWPSNRSSEELISAPPVIAFGFIPYRHLRPQEGGWATMRSPLDRLAARFLFRTGNTLPREFSDHPSSIDLYSGDSPPQLPHPESAWLSLAERRHSQEFRGCVWIRNMELAHVHQKHATLKFDLAFQAGFTPNYAVPPSNRDRFNPRHYRLGTLIAPEEPGVAWEQDSVTITTRFSFRAADIIPVLGTALRYIREVPYVTIRLSCKLDFSSACLISSSFRVSAIPSVQHQVGCGNAVRRYRMENATLTDILEVFRSGKLLVPSRGKGFGVAPDRVTSNEIRVKL